MATVAFVALALLSALPIAAARASTDADGLYKCRGAGTTPVYQDSPCPPGRELRNFADRPANVSVIPFTPAPPAPSAAATRGPKPAKPPKTSAKEKPRLHTDAAERRHVKEGMTEGEVLAKLGPPDLQARRAGRLMRWTYLPATGDPQTVTVIRFDDGRVKQVERRILR